MLIEAVFYNNPGGYPPIINSIRLLAGAGFRMRMTVRDDGKRWGVSYPEGVRVRRVGTRGGSSWREYTSFVAAALRRGKRKAALFVGHDMHGFLPAKLLATLYRRPLVYHCHDFADPALLTTRGLRMVHAFERHFARTAHLVIVPDAERGEVIARTLRLKRPPLVVANSPLSGSVASGEALHEALAARGMHLKEVLFRQGRIGPGHGIEATIRSMPGWASAQWGFVVMGVGEEAYLDKLMTLASSLGMEGGFAILPPVGYDEVASFTPGASAGHALYDPIHVNNLYIATASNKIMEHMAAGLPLLVSDTHALRALVRKYNCGLTADESAPESITSAVNVLLSDREKARRMGLAARQAFETEFCYERQFAPALRAIKALALRSK